MNFREMLVHERTLLGAVDSYLKELVQNRAYLVSCYEEELNELIERWLVNGGENHIEAMYPAWLAHYIAIATQPKQVEAAIADFQAWLVRRNLMDRPWLISTTPALWV